MNTADRIQLLRRQKGLSQEQLADEIGVSRQLVSKWENEQALPDMERIIILSEYFNTTTDYILKGIEPLKEETSSHEKLTEDQIRSILLDVFLWILIAIAAILIIWLSSMLQYFQGANTIQADGSEKYLSGYDIFLSLQPLGTIWISSWIALITAGGLEIYRVLKRRKKQNHQKEIINKTN